MRKRNVEPDRIDRAVTGIVRQLESSGETEVASGEVGRLVMEALKSLDDVAYVRFASVYRNFREAKDFHDVLGELKARGRVGRAMSDEAQNPRRDETDRRFMAAAIRLSLPASSA